MLYSIPNLQRLYVNQKPDSGMQHKTRGSVLHVQEYFYCTLYCCPSQYLLENVFIIRTFGVWYRGQMFTAL